MERKKIYNYDSREAYSGAKVIGGNPNGIFNFNKSNHRWAQAIYRNMRDRTWFPQQINVSKDKVNYPKLDPRTKEAYDLFLAQLITNDSIQSSQLVERINSYITSPIVSAALIQQSAEECETGDTEVLKDNGVWTRLDELKVGDRILATNENLISYFTPVTHMTVREIDSKIYNFESKHFSQKTTEGHRMPVFEDDGRFKILTTKELFFKRQKNNMLKYNFLAAAPTYVNPRTYPASELVTASKPEFWNSPKLLSLPVLLKIMIALQADGTIPRTKYALDTSTGLLTTARAPQATSRRVTFSFSKERKIDYLKQLLKIAKIDFREITEKESEYTKKTPNKKLRTNFVFTMPGDFKLSKVFYDYIHISSFTLASAREFIDEVIKWDGWDYGTDTVGYDTTIKENADFVCAVATLAGYRVKVRLDKDPRSETFNDLYRVSIAKTSLMCRRGTVQLTEEDYKGKVYCPTVKGGLFVCRHNGKVSLTGNCVHSDSYSVMAEDICQDTDRIYDLWMHNEELYLKNKAVADMFSVLYNGDNPTEEDLLVAFGANQVLENMVFPVGFVFFFSIENTMGGTSEMIAEICKDELLSHVPLFKNIFRTAIKESFNGVVPVAVKEKITKMVQIMTEAEIRWGKYATKGLLGFSDESIERFVHTQANEVFSNLMLPKIYPEYTIKENPLQRLLMDHIKGGEVATKTLFFEGNPVDYSKSSVDMSADLGSVNWDD